MSEQLTALQEMDRFSRLISKAEDIFLKGLPDVAESRPHSSVNS